MSSRLEIDDAEIAWGQRTGMAGNDNTGLTEPGEGAALRRDAVYPCAFEKAILARCCRCGLARRTTIAEREAVGCGSPVARENCATLRELLLANSVFALGLARLPESLPHAASLKSQCGGLLGLQQAVSPGEEVADVHQLVLAAREKYGGLQALPFSAIVKSVSAFRARPRR